jgi:hypothetical protein
MKGFIPMTRFQKLVFVLIIPFYLFAREYPLKFNSVAYAHISAQPVVLALK